MTTPPPSNPMAVARVLLLSWTEDGRPTLLHWRGQWMDWKGTHWRELDAAEVRAVAYKELEHAQYQDVTPKGAVETKDWEPNKRKIADLMEAMSAIRILSPSVDAPAWTDGTPQQSPIVACTNGLLDVTTRQLRPLTPEYFNLVSVPFDYDPDAPEPAEWLAFLRKVFKDDPDSIALLQEYFGYVISGRTDMHKILLIIGATRSGKGTIGRVLTALVGKGNTAGPTLASLAQNFGLSSLLGKPFAVISDARLSGRDGHQVVERLLTISGEDTIDVDRKYRDLWTGRLPTRFLILSNELPSFGDVSGAIAHRFMVLNMPISWLGKEDRDLGRRIEKEMPGILNWALDGLERLAPGAQFTEPQASRDAVTLMEDAASPMSAFVRQCCRRGPEHQVAVDTLYAAWVDWCQDNGRKETGTKQWFGRNLQAAVPQAKITRPNIHGVRTRMYTGLAIGSDPEDDESTANNYRMRGHARTGTPDQGFPSGPEDGLRGPDDVPYPSRSAQGSTQDPRKAQVTGSVRTGPRNSPLSAVHERPEAPCVGCRLPNTSTTGSAYCDTCRTAA